MSNVKSISFSLSVNSLEEIEDALTSMRGKVGFDLKLSATALDKRRGALRDAAFLQLIQTWARQSPDATLRLVEKPGFEPLEEACRYSVGIGALSLAPKIAVGSKVVSRVEALLPSAERMDLAYEGDYAALVKGRTVDLISVSGAKRQYLKPLFQGEESTEVKSHPDLKLTLRDLAKAVNPRSLASLDADVIGALATLTHELFENSQEHGTSDEMSNAYRRHVESVFVNHLVFLNPEKQNDLLVNETLRRYWDSLSIRQRGRQQVAGLCLSFLDSGPGMASKLRKSHCDQLTHEDESKALRECLKLHVSTKSESGTGSGLMEVLEEVSALSGFIRIRSGRQAIFRCFAPGDDHGPLYEEFKDWFPGRELSEVSGTLVSVFIPVPRIEA